MKKLLAMLLSLMLMLPVLAQAELVDGLADLDELIGGADKPTEIVVLPEMPEGRIDHVLSIKELRGFSTGDPTMDAAMKDLFEALGLRFSLQGAEGDMALVISGKDVLTVGGTVSGEEIYLSSNLLGGVVAVGMDEIEPLIGKFLDMFVAMEAISARDAQEIKAMVKEVFAGMDASMGQAADEMEDILQQVMAMDFSALEKAGNVIMDNMAFVEAPSLPKMCDPASGGIELRLDNDEFLQIVLACLDFVEANPILKEYMSASGEFYTEEEIQEMWEYYKTSKVYESEQHFRDRHPTVDVVLRQARENLQGAKLLDGEFIIGLYMNDMGEPVYGLIVLPMDEGDTTSMLEVVYTRQTVAQGVSHVLRFTADGKSVILDTLVTEKETVSTLYAANGEKSLDIVIPRLDGNKFQATLSVYENGKYVNNKGEKIFTALLEGEWDFSNARAYFSGKLTMTNADKENMVFTVVADYAFNGEDVTGATEVGFDVDGMGLTIRLDSVTGEAKPSIVAGDVTRPAAMNDTEFQTWFVGLINNVSVTLTTMLTALPESVLMLVLSSGMM